jgi:hypothetical protein
MRPTVISTESEYPPLPFFAPFAPLRDLRFFPLCVLCAFACASPPPPFFAPFASSRPLRDPLPRFPGAYYFANAL